MPKGLCGPYSARSVRPATIVGSAKGRSMRALMKGLPAKSSRTSTQAMAVPMRALMTVTMPETVKVSCSAASACGDVMAAQNSSRPSDTERHRMAEMGMRTSRLR